MGKTGGGQLLTADTAADAVIALEYAYRVATFSQHRRTDKGVDTTTDDDVIALVHVVISERDRDFGRACSVHQKIVVHGTVVGCPMTSHSLARGN